MKILALDIATKTGWAMEGDYGVEDFSIKKDQPNGLRLLKFRHWLSELIVESGPFDLLAYEQQHHRGRAATEVGIGMITEMIAIAALHNVPYKSVHSGKLKKYFTGHGKATKAMMIEAAKELGYEPEDDNVADACLILEYALKHFT